MTNDEKAYLELFTPDTYCIEIPRELAKDMETKGWVDWQPPNFGTKLWSITETGRKALAAAVIAAAVVCAAGAADAGARGGDPGGSNQAVAGANAVAGARATAGANALASAQQRQASFNSNVNVNRAAGGAGGAGGSGTGGSSSATVINSASGGRGGSWWQGTSATVIPPAMASNGTCADSVSFGIVGGPGGLSFGFPQRNADCNIREVAKTYLMLASAKGDSRAKTAAWRVLCLSPEAQQAGLCK